MKTSAGTARLLAAGTVLLASSALADEPLPPVGYVCKPAGAAGTASLDRQQFLSWLLYAYAQLPPALVARVQIQPDGTAVIGPAASGTPTYPQMQAMALTDLCLSADPKTGACGEFAAAEAKAVLYLQGFISTPYMLANDDGRGNGAAAFDFRKDATATYHATRSSKPPASSSDDPLYPAKEILDPSSDAWSVTCQAAPKQDGSKSTSLSDLRVRDKSDDLLFDNKSTKFKAANGFSVGSSRDLQGHKDSYNFVGVVGYAFPQSGADPKGDAGLSAADSSRAFFQPIPFLSLDREYTSPSSSSPNGTDIYNFGMGGILDVHSPLVPGSGMHEYNDLAITLDYVRSLSTGAKVEQLGVSDQPAPKISFLQHYVGDGPIQFNARFYLKLGLGRVLDAGTNSTLLQTGNYRRVGPDVVLNFAGQSAGWAQYLSLSLEYLYLRQYGSTLDSLQQRNANLSFALDKDKNYAITVKYVDGRNLDTLNLQRNWTINLAIKY